MTTPTGPGSQDPVVPDQDECTRPADAIEVARVLGAWGVKGGIKLKAFSSDPQALFSSKRWFVEPGERKVALPVAPGARQPVLPRLLRVIQVREQGDGIVATCQELTDQAERISDPVARARFLSEVPHNRRIVQDAAQAGLAT